MKDIFAYRLKNARIRQGLSVKALTELLGVSKQMISKYENGLSMPDGSKLIALANALGVKADYFFNPAGVTLDHVKFRKKAKTGKSELESIKVNILNQIENYLIIEDILSVKSEFTNPLAKFHVSEINEIEEISNCLRDIWDIGNDPISNIISLLEANEIKIVEIDERLETSFDGLSVFVNDKFPTIVINKNYEIERKRFTLLHELGHLLLSIDDKFSEKEQEKICDRFAASVLLPKRVVYDQIGKKRTKISLNEFINIQKQYGISISAIMYRLIDLKVLHKGKLKSFFIKQNSSPELKKAINHVRFLGDEKSDRFRSLVYKALSQDIISISKASALLESDVDSIQQQLTIF